MSIKELAYKLEEMEFSAEIISNTITAVHDAMVEGPNAPSTYFSALFGVDVSMREFHKSLKELMDAAFEIMRTESNKRG